MGKDVGKDSIFIRIPKKLKNRVKHVAIEMDMTQQTFVEIAIKNYLEKLLKNSSYED